MRATLDIDLMTSCDLQVLPDVAEELRREGLAVDVRERVDYTYPLDGSITVRRDDTGPVQVMTKRRASPVSAAIIIINDEHGSHESCPVVASDA
jgi:hypothetical protein